MKFQHLLFGIAVACATACSANADLVLDLRLDDTTRSRNVMSGSSVFVDMFLVDTDGTSVMSADGLIGAGGRIFDVPSGTSATGSFFSPGTGFVSQTPPSVPPGIAAGQVTTMLFAPPIAAVVPGAGVTVAAMAGAMEVFIGTFEVTATGGVGDTHTLTAGVFGGSDNGNTAGPVFTPVDLDGLILASGAAESVTLNVTTAAVPEPSSLFVAGLLGVAAFVVRRRKGASTKSNSVV